MLETLVGNGVSVGMGVKVGCIVGAGFVAEGVSITITAVAVSVRIGAEVSGGGAAHAARQRENVIRSRRKRIVTETKVPGCAVRE